VEVVHDGQGIVSDLKQRIDALVVGSTVEVLRMKTNVTTANLEAGPSVELQDLQVDEVFERCLQAHEIPEAQQEELRLLYRIVPNGCLKRFGSRGDC
jgi:exonuclease SbcD